VWEVELDSILKLDRAERWKSRRRTSSPPTNLRVRPGLGPPLGIRFLTACRVEGPPISRPRIKVVIVGSRSNLPSSEPIRAICRQDSTVERLGVQRHARRSDVSIIGDEILGLSKMRWNRFDLYARLLGAPEDDVLL
jgi:hypothetical protein